MRKDCLPLETVKNITDILKSNELDYKIISTINNCDFTYSVQIELVQLPGVYTNGKGLSYESALASALAEMMEL